MTTLETLPPIRLTELTDCGGCAAKLGADLLADALTGLGAETAPDGAHRRTRTARRCGRLPGQPGARDHRHARLLPAARRRRPDVRRDRRGQRPLGRVRDGRPGAVRAVDRGIPRGPAAGHPGRDLRRRSAKVREAGGTLAGGHTIRDPEPKYGLAVIGAAHPDRLLAQGRCPARRPAAADQAARHRRARVGLAPGADRARGPRRGGRPDADAQPGGVRSARRAGVTAATDVTGFGLLGHGLEMARASGARFMFEAGSLPVLGRRARAGGRRRRDRRRGAQPPLRRRRADRRGWQSRPSS